MNKRIAVIIVIAFAVVLALYLIVFRYGLSHSTTTWSEFGGYVSGVLMPILTAINIYVFVKLTNAISEKDSQRSKKEMLFQKQLMLMQFRKKEIDEFEKMTDAVFSFAENSDYNSVKKEISYLATNAMLYLASFQTTKRTLFNLEKDSCIIKEMKELMELVGRFSNQIDNSFPSKEELKKYYELKYSISRSLQEITIS